MGKLTSSLLLCFCLLALTDDDPPASLVVVFVLWVCTVSSTGRGMLDAEGLAAAAAALKGMPPRACPRLGVPLRVLPDIA